MIPLLRITISAFSIACTITAFPASVFSQNKINDWSSETLAAMTLEEKVGQLFQLRVFADYPSLDDGEIAYTRMLIERYHIGSIGIGARQKGENLAKADPAIAAAVINKLQEGPKIALLVGADLERGLASRFSSVPDFPFPMAFGAVGAEAPVVKEAEITAREARAIGIQLTFGPVADLNSNPLNPSINTRSFGEDPAAVSRLVAAYVRGAHDKTDDRLLVTLKHFPGEGDTTEDPHVGLTQILSTTEELKARDLKPFEAGIAAGADAVMLAQALIPSINSEPETVATLSPQLVQKELRGELGFRGLVITDALEMRGLAAAYPKDIDVETRVAIDALKAGNDILALPRNLNKTYLSIVNAVANGEIPEKRIDDSVLRILRVKAALGLDKSRFVELGKVKAVFSDPASYEFAQQVSDDSLTLVRNNSHLLPLRSEYRVGSSVTSQRNVIVITLTDSKGSRLGPTFDKEFLARNPNAKIFHFYNDQIDSDVNPFELLPLLKSANAIVVAAYVTHTAPRQVSRGGKMVNAIGFAGPGAQFLGQVLGVNPQKTIVVALGSPYVIDDFPAIQNYICTYSLVTTAEVSAVRALFGEIQNHASLPVTLPGVAARGFAIPWPQK